MRAPDERPPRGWRVVFAIAMAVCSVVPLARPSPADDRSAAGSESPTEWDGRPLRPLALSAVEQRFADRFPGRIARLTD
ncbi:MAG TPA: hypothetical protein VGP22_02335, partial [Albitalea sp.]|nr:hypothetical protein [Albitalea sp.]